MKPNIFLKLLFPLLYQSHHLSLYLSFSLSHTHSLIHTYAYTHTRACTSLSLSLSLSLLFPSLFYSTISLQFSPDFSFFSLTLFILFFSISFLPNLSFSRSVILFLLYFPIFSSPSWYLLCLTVPFNQYPQITVRLWSLGSLRSSHGPQLNIYCNLANGRLTSSGRLPFASPTVHHYLPPDNPPSPTLTRQRQFPTLSKIDALGQNAVLIVNFWPKLPKPGSSGTASR